jgi:hypothetical protein
MVIEAMITMAEKTSVLVGSWNCVACDDQTPLDLQSANVTSNLSPGSTLLHNGVLHIPVRGRTYKQLG